MAEVIWQQGRVTRAQRAAMRGHAGATVWLTGLPAAGKTTIAIALEEALVGMGVSAYRLDGDNLRHGLCGDLGFSAADRDENIRRVGEVAKLFADAGTVALASFISPYGEGRAAVRRIHEQAGLAFIEAYVDCPLSVAEERDPKGMYARARRGEIKGFTGIDDPYEAPEAPEVMLQSHLQSVEDEVTALCAALRERGIIPRFGDA